LSSDRSDVPFDPQITAKWLPVDMYIGGAEHSVLHLLYSRFITTVLHDLGHLPFEEPFVRFRAHGLLTKDGAKMSKSKGNVVNPDQYIEEYGADTLRTYLMFLGPYDRGGDFSDRGIAGIRRFLNRVWQWALHHRDFLQSDSIDLESQRRLHQTIHKVSEDIQSLKSEEEAIAIARQTDAIQRYLNAQEIRRVVYVPGRILNFLR
jgi:leucyl-tRNA synthetase